MENLLNQLWFYLDQQEMPHKTVVLRAFQIIEHTPSLLEIYQQVPYSRQYLNSRISKEIKKHYGLTNKGRSNEILGTMLIRSYTIF